MKWYSLLLCKKFYKSYFYCDYYVLLDVLKTALHIKYHKQECVTTYLNTRNPCSIPKSRLEVSQIVTYYHPYLGISSQGLHWSYGRQDMQEERHPYKGIGAQGLHRFARGKLTLHWPQWRNFTYSFQKYFLHNQLE